METADAIVAIVGGVVAIVGGVVAIWFRLRRRSDGEPGAGAAVGGQPGAPTIVAQAGATINYYGTLPQAKTPEVKDAFEEGQRLYSEGIYREAIRAFERAFAAAEDESQRAALHMLLGDVFVDVGELEEAEGHYFQALTSLDSTNDRVGIATAVYKRGVVLLERGDLDRAEETLQYALERHKEVGDKVGEAKVLLHLSGVAFRRGDITKARTIVVHAGKLADEVGDSDLARWAHELLEDEELSES